MINHKENLLVRPLKKRPMRVPSRLVYGRTSARRVRRKLSKSGGRRRPVERKIFAFSRPTIVIVPAIVSIFDGRCYVLGDNAHDAKRAEVLSRNQNEAWSLRSAAPTLLRPRREGERIGRGRRRMRHDCIVELNGTGWFARSARILRSCPLPRDTGGQGYCGIRKYPDFPRFLSAINSTFPHAPPYS